MKDKKTLIFEASIELLKDNTNPSSITIQEIATKAGIGKGTVYEYFKSKEEIINKTLSYIVEIEIDKIRQIINDASYFKDAIKDICLNVVNLHKRFSAFELALKKDNNYDTNIFCDIKLKDKINKTMMLLINKGIKDQIINQNNDYEYCCFVIVGAMNSFKISTTQGEINKALDYTYQTINKALR